MPVIAGVYQDFFDAVQQKVTDQGVALLSIRDMNTEMLEAGRIQPKAARLPMYGPTVPGDVGFKPHRAAAYVSDKPYAETVQGRHLLKRLNQDAQGQRVGLRSVLEYLANGVGVKLLYGKEQTTQRSPGSYLHEARVLRSRAGNWQADIHNLGYAVFEDAQALGADWIEALGPKLGEIGNMPGSFAPSRRDGDKGTPADQGFAEWFRRFMWEPTTNPAEVTNRIMAWMDNNLPDHAKTMRDGHRAVRSHLNRHGSAQFASHQNDKGKPASPGRAVADWLQSAAFRALSSEAAVDFKVIRPTFHNVKKGKDTKTAQRVMNQAEDTPADVRNASQWMNAISDELTAAIAGETPSNRGLRIRQTSDESLGDMVEAIEDPEVRQQLIDQFKLTPRDLRNVGFGNVLRLTDYTVRDIVQEVNKEPKTGEKADLWADFENYGFMRTALDRWNKKQMPYPMLTEGIEPPQLMKMVADAERANPHFKAQYDRLNHFMDRMLLASLVSGEFAPEDLLRIQGAYESYWPLPRDMGQQYDHSAAAGGSDGVMPSAGVMRAFGGSEPFMNVLGSVERRTKMALQAYYQNATMRSILYLQEQVRGIDGLDAGHKAEVLQMVMPLQLDWKLVATLEPAEKAAAVAEYLNQEAAKAQGVELDAVPANQRISPEEVAMLEPGAAIEVWRQEKPSAVRVIGVNIGGSRRYYQVADPTLFEYFARTAQPIDLLTQFSSFIGGINQERQKVLTQNLAFAGRSLFRDAPSAMLFGEDKLRFVPWGYLGLGIYNRLTNKWPESREEVGEVWSDARIEAEREERRLAKLTWQDVHDRALAVPDWEVRSAAGKAASLTGKVLRAPLSMADMANWLSNGYLLPGWANLPLGRQITAIPKEMFRIAFSPAHAVNFITGGRYVSNLIERLPREGQAARLLKKGYSGWRARAGAMRVTGNFSARAGDVRIQEVHRFALFMNAWAQISYQTIRGLAVEPDSGKKLSNWLAIGTAAATLGGVLPVIAYLMMSDEQRKRREEAKDEERLGYLWLPIPTPEGSALEDQFLRLPQDYGPPGAATSFTSYMVEKHLFDQGPQGEQAAMAVLKRSLSLPSVTDLITPEGRTLIELMLNRSFFYSGEIVPAWMDREYEGMPELQAFPDQRGWETWLGRRIGMSPIKVRYAIGQTMTRQSLDVLDNAERLANYPRAQPDQNPMDELTEIPAIGGLFAREPRGWRSESVETLADRETLTRNLNKLADRLEEGPYADKPKVQQRVQMLREDAGRLEASSAEFTQTMKQIRRLWDAVKDERAKPEPNFETIREYERRMMELARRHLGLGD